MRRGIITLLILLFLGIVGGAAGVLAGFWYFGRGLPDHRQLAEYQPSVTTRVHAGDGRILAEFAIEKRVFVPYDAIPRSVVNAFLAAEDKSFFTHPGVSLPDIARAALQNALNYGSRRPVGASTITQQVAKNMLLTNEVSLSRKAKEAILALRIEEALSKRRILELYLNEIYLGFGAYGVASAAMNYFDRGLDELTLAEAAFLAVLPKAPNNYDPRRYPERARERRDWVLGRMLDDGHITQAEYDAARAQPIVTRQRGPEDTVRADYFAEEVRRELVARFGERELFRGGLSVRTSMDPKMQAVAEAALRKGLMAYDRRHGWRGPVARIDANSSETRRLLTAHPRPPGTPPEWQLAMVRATANDAAELAFADGTAGTLPLEEMRWARRTEKDQRVGAAVRAPADVVAAGDLVLVEPSAAQPASGPRRFALRQIPNVGGAAVIMDPHTGRVRALVGGWSYEQSQFNRATQAMRQPGSSFKPFVYLPALESGFTPASLILDAPIVVDQGPGLPPWRPANYTRNFYGPSPMRVGIEQSRNLMTIRLAQAVGMEKVAATAEKLGEVDKLPLSLAMALGAAETTLMRQTTAYAMFVNGGRRIEPTLIDRVQDRDGKTVFRHDARACEGCRSDVWLPDMTPPDLPDTRAQAIDPLSAYQMVSMLQGVVERGTGRRLRELNRPLAGKTGTTNDSFDAWFMGFSPDLAAGVWVGFDNPRTLGPNETGSSVAVPIFKDMMGEVLAGTPVVPFRTPPGIRLVRINPQTGQAASPGERDAILEAFKPGTEANRDSQVLDGGGQITVPANGIAVPGSEGGDGIY
ncbi:MAG: PBP1A family penicillin-binding protein [Alphaproteobacteria bacterium]|nr:PBP1A family penicillin-binding protein [Alphaproteobacteria bacterium]